MNDWKNMAVITPISNITILYTYFCHCMSDPAYELAFMHLRIFCEFAGFNSTLRQGNITHHEYIQVCTN